MEMEPSGAKILVVDDIPENVRLLEAVLVPRGYEVFPAMSGEEALKLVEEHDPDLVLLDVVMPGMDGYTVCRTLRANEDTALLPVIMVTSSIGPEKTEAIEAGADDFIPKPFNHGELLTRVRSLLRIKRYQDEIKELNRTLEQRVQSQVDTLEHQADELRASRARIVAAADDERRRIERDLHDGAQQYLVGLAANLRAAEGLIESDPAKAKAILDELSGTIGQAMRISATSRTGSIRPCCRTAVWARRWRMPHAGSRFRRGSIRTGSAATTPPSRRRSISAASRRFRTQPSTVVKARPSACGSRTGPCASRFPTTVPGSILTASRERA